MRIDAGLDAAGSPDKVVHTTFSVKPGASAAGEFDQFSDIDGSLTGLFRVDDAGELHIYDEGSGAQEGRWLPTGTRFSLDDQGNAKDWIDLAFRQDYEAGIWDVVINGRIFRANLLMEGDPATLETIELIGQSHTSLYVDNLAVSRDATAFSDLDRDGLPDNWEMIHGLESENNDRNADPDADGLSNIEELVLGTSPIVADTDGDGASDGDEYLLGHDPLRAGRGVELGAETFTGLNGSLTVYESMNSNGYVDITIYWPTNNYMKWKAWLYNPGDYPHIYDSHTGQQFSGEGDVNWANGYYYQDISAYVGYGDERAFLYIWANHSSPGYEDSLAFTVGHGGSNAVTIPYSVAHGGNMGSEEAAEKTLSEHCYICDSDCDAIGIGSVKFGVALGRMHFGDQSLVLNVHEKRWSDRVYSRLSVQFRPPEGVAVGYSSTPIPGGGRLLTGKLPRALSWVKTETTFTTLEDIPHGYTIRQYTLDQVRSGTPVGEPYKTIKVQNPDPLGRDGVKRLLLEKSEDGNHLVSEYRFHSEEGREIWQLFQGEPGRHLTQPARLRELIIDDPRKSERGDFTHTRTVKHWSVKTSRLETDSVKREIFRRYPFGVRKIQRVMDPEGVARTVDLTYYDDPNLEFPIKGRVKSTRWADGSWQYYTYDAQGRDAKVYSPIGNMALPTTEPGTLEQVHLVTHEYDGPDYQKKTTTWVKGVAKEVEYTRWNRVEAGVEREIVRITAAHAGASPDDPANQVHRELYVADSTKPRRTDHPDGSATVHTYTTNDDERLEVVESLDQRGEVITRSSRRLHPSGAVLEEKQIDVPSGVVTQHRVTGLEGLDERFRPVTTLNQVTGKITRRSYMCCGLEWESNGEGNTTRFEYDVLGRVIRRQVGYKDPLTPGNTLAVLSDEAYQLDGTDRQVESVSTLEPGYLPRAKPSSSRYNPAGEQTAQEDADGVIKEYRTIMLEDGGRLELRSLPRSGHDDLHRISSRQYEAGGRLVRERIYASSDPFAIRPDPGTLVLHRFYEEGRDQRGFYKQVSDIASIFDHRVTRTYFNALGQRTEIIHAYGTSLAASEFFEYARDGKLIRHIGPDGAVTRLAYNHKGERIVTALDLKVEPGEAPDHIDYEVDRITRTSTELATNADGLDVRRVTNEIFTENGPVITSIQEQALDGTYSATIYNGLRATRQRVEGDQPGQWTITVTQPDGSHTVEAYENGRLARTTRHASGGTAISWIEQQFDAYGRLWKITDSRTGTTTIHYDENGRRWKVSAPNPETRSATEGTLDTLYHFDALGQVITIIKPGGGQVHRVYSANGTLHRVHGHHTTDVEFRYNGRAERIGMITYYGPGDTPAQTRWYFNVRGQLAFKRDASGKRVRYTYTLGGELETRTWARGIVVTYHYDPDNHVDLRTIDYSDRTPDVHITYTRLGQKKTVKDAGGLLTYGYDPEAPYTLLSETRHGPLYGEPKAITYNRDELDRPTGFQIGTATDPARDYAVRYGYDLVSRLDLIAARGYEFRYSYLPHSTSDRVKTLSALFVKETELTYEPGRDAIASVTNRVGLNHDQLLSQYGYAINADGQRISRTTTHGGATFTDAFGFDPDTGGLISSKRAASVDANHTFAFDKIGNREVATSGQKTPITYQPNALNQYLSIEGDSSISLTHDADGNLTRRGDRTFTWDADNRLIAIHERGILIASYTYDHKSRRIARWTRDGVDERYLYQGWNLIAVYRPGETEPEETYTWGKDLSGSIQGAGGVGGLLFAKKRGHGKDAWIYHFDANGNVTEVTDSKGKLLDRYEYDPFGQLVTEPALPENRYRFSTKPRDGESAFCYYGYRYYDPIDGRWLSRDPIGELGGTNLYGFVGNNSIDHLDLLGHDYSNRASWIGWERAPQEQWEDDGATGEFEWVVADSQSYSVSFTNRNVQTVGTNYAVTATLSGSYDELGLSASYSRTFSSQQEASLAATSSFSFSFSVEEKKEVHKLFVREWRTYYTFTSWGLTGTYLCDSGDVQIGDIIQWVNGICRHAKLKCGSVPTLRRVTPEEFVITPTVSTGEFRLSGDASGSGNSAAALRTVGENAANGAAQNWFNSQ